MAAVTLAASLLGGGVGAFGAPAAYATGGEATVVDIEFGDDFMGLLFVLSDGSAGYCLDEGKSALLTGDNVREADWDSYKGDGKPWNQDATVRGKILWILSHSYPALTPVEVSALTGLPLMTKESLISATQVAIWSFTNGMQMPAAAYADKARPLYQWLTENATPIQPNSPDGGSVDLAEGASFNNVVGEPIGPFEVSADDVAVVNLSATAGATIVDEAGAPVGAAVDGDEVWLEAGNPQSATITATGTSVHHTGEIWSHTVAPDEYQEVSMGSSDPIVRQDSITVDIVDVPVVPEPEPTEDNPTVATVATDKADGDQVLPAGGGTVTDEVAYTGLLAGKEYTLTGELMDKATGAATGITASKTFTPSAADGTVSLDFTVTPGYEGASLVAFEVISDTVGEIASHEDINSASQTVSVDVPVIPEPPVEPPVVPEPEPTEDNPSVVTLATDKADGDQVLPAGGGVVTDEVLYTGLLAGKEYTLTGELMDKATGAATGITASKTFTPSAADGTVSLDFTVTPGYEGASLVAFEVISDTVGEIASHEDITAVEQTVSVDVPVIPEPPVYPEEPPVVPEPTEDDPMIATLATDKADGDQVLPAEGGTVTDEVLYVGLLPGKEYTLTGELMDQATGAATGITASKTFTPSDADGSVFLDFTVPAGYEGKELVAFEVISDTAGEIASHEDINSAAQTVTVEVPVIPEPPVTPEEPVVPPVTPEEPETPVTPEEPATPEDPETPATPEEPATPEAPETPATPEDPATPDETEAPTPDDAKLATTGGELPVWLIGGGLGAVALGLGLVVAIRRRSAVES